VLQKKDDCTPEKVRAEVRDLCKKFPIDL